VNRGNAVGTGNGAVIFLGQADREIPTNFSLVIDYEYTPFQRIPPMGLHEVNGQKNAPH
jgi:hypothetical protein